MLDSAASAVKFLFRRSLTRRTVAVDSADGHA